MVCESDQTKLGRAMIAVLNRQKVERRIQEHKAQPPTTKMMEMINFQLLNVTYGVTLMAYCLKTYPNIDFRAYISFAFKHL